MVRIYVNPRGERKAIINDHTFSAVLRTLLNIHRLLQSSCLNTCIGINILHENETCNGHDRSASSRFDSPTDARNISTLQKVQTDSVTHPATHSVCVEGIFKWWPWREASNSFPPTHIKNAWSYTATSSRAFTACYLIKYLDYSYVQVMWKEREKYQCCVLQRCVCVLFSSKEGCTDVRTLIRNPLHKVQEKVAPSY